MPLRDDGSASMVEHGSRTGVELRLVFFRHLTVRQVVIEHQKSRAVGTDTYISRRRCRIVANTRIRIQQMTAGWAGCGWTECRLHSVSRANGGKTLLVLVHRPFLYMESRPTPLRDRLYHLAPKHGSDSRMGSIW